MSELKERRAEFIAKVRRFAEHLASESEFDCGRVTVGEDRQKGIWGEGMTKWLEERCGGDCSTNITWDGGDEKIVSKYDKKPTPKRQVNLRFRFDSPCVAVELDYRKTFAELQFSDSVKNDDGEFEHTGNFALHEVIAWGYHGGMPLLEKLCGEWEEFE